MHGPMGVKISFGIESDIACLTALADRYVRCRTWTSLSILCATKQVVDGKNHRALPYFTALRTALGLWGLDLWNEMEKAGKVGVIQDIALYVRSLRQMDGP